MKENGLFCIGKVEEICRLSKKTLRYYDKMGILSPDKVSNESGYRYYSKKTLLSVPMIKYYKQSGFKLEEMRSLLNGTNFSVIEHRFRDKIDELKKEEIDLKLKIRSIEDWYKLILEAEMVLENNMKNISVKYIEPTRLVYLEQDFKYDYMDSIINIEFTNYIDSIKNAITGPVIIEYPSIEDKIKGTCKRARILQKTILECEDELTVNYGGCMFASCYHIGSHEKLNETYTKIKKWAKENNYSCDSKSYERYVIDYWTTKDTNKFVTEVMLKLTKDKCRKIK